MAGTYEDPIVLDDDLSSDTESDTSSTPSLPPAPDWFQYIEWDYWFYDFYQGTFGFAPTDPTFRAVLRRDSAFRREDTVMNRLGVTLDTYIDGSWRITAYIRFTNISLHNLFLWCWRLSVVLFVAAALSALG